MRLDITAAYLRRSFCGSFDRVNEAARRIAARSKRDGRCKTYVYADRLGCLYASRQGKSATLQVMSLRGKVSLLAVFVNETEDQILSALNARLAI